MYRLLLKCNKEGSAASTCWKPRSLCLDPSEAVAVDTVLTAAIPVIPVIARAPEQSEQAASSALRLLLPDELAILGEQQREQPEQREIGAPLNHDGYPVNVH